MAVRPSRFGAVLHRVLVAGALALLAAGPLPAAEAAVPWATLNGVEREVLATLESDWTRMDTAGQQKWLKLAGRFASLRPEDQVRIRARMAEWSRLTPVERMLARQQFLDSRDWPARDRQERWQAYQALSPEQRQTLAESALARSAAASAAASPSRRVPSPSSTATTPSRAGAAVQIQPGATTKPLLVRSTPPAHQQAGMPKIAATPAFVDPATLLPRRGPQGAAVQSAAASAPAGAAR